MYILRKRAYEVLCLNMKNKEYLNNLEENLDDLLYIKKKKRKQRKS